MGAPLPVDWNEVKTLSLAIGLTDAVTKLSQAGMPVTQEAARQRSSREGWFADRRKAREALANPQQSKAELMAIATGQPVTSVTMPTAADILSQLGPDSKVTMAIAGNRAAHKFAKMDEDELVLPETAQSAKAWTGNLAILHGWRESAGGQPLTVNIGIASLDASPTVAIDVVETPKSLPGNDCQSQ